MLEGGAWGCFHILIHFYRNTLSVKLLRSILAYFDFKAKWKERRMSYCALSSVQVCLLLEMETVTISVSYDYDGVNVQFSSKFNTMNSDF